MSSETAPRASILIVDDYPANILAVEAILAPLGHELVRAESGEEALKALLRQDFAVIVMDVQMPGLDGFQTASLIKQRDGSRHIPIIFLTAISKDAAHVLEGYAHGAVDYLLKPFDAQILRSKVSVFVELWQRGELLKQREAKLRELEREKLERASAARYAALIESMPQGVLAMRPAGDIYFCNSVWQTYTGLGCASTVERICEVIHPDDRLALRAAWVEAQRTQRPLEREARLRRGSDGAYRWHLLHVVPQRDDDGALAGWITTATDIDTEKQARNGRARQPRQGRISGDGLARAARPAQRHPRLDAHAARRQARRRPRRARARDRRAQRGHAGGARRGHARRLAHHHRQAGAQGRRRRPAHRRRRRLRHRAHGGRRQADHRRARSRRRRRPRLGRPRSPAAGGMAKPVDPLTLVEVVHKLAARTDQTACATAG